MTWLEIEEGGNEGYQCLDLGRMGSDTAGLVLFKRHFAAEEKKLYYYHYPKMPKLVSSYGRESSIGSSSGCGRDCHCLSSESWSPWPFDNWTRPAPGASLS